MTDSLEKIKEEHQDVATVPQEADLRSDSDIRSLTGAELHQPLPEQNDLSFEIIHKQSVVQLLREMKDISGDFKDALTDNGVLVDNLPILKEMQTHMKDMQSFLDGRICSLANIQNQPNQESVTNVTMPHDDYCPEGAHGEVMSDLLDKIKEEHQDVAKVLQEADLSSDSDIRSLTQEELNQLFPGLKNFKLRRRIFEMIQNQKPVKQLPPTGVNIGIPSRGEIMTDLLNKIKGEHPDVAKVLQDAGLRSDSDIRSLTGAELHQLLPGKENLKLRRTIFEMIKQEPVGQLLREMKNFIPNEDFKAALTGNGVLVDYLCIMKDMQTQVKHIQSFQEAHIRFLEENIQNQPDPESATNLKEPLSDPPQEAHGHSSDLLEEIRNQDRHAADVLREADLSSDSDIRSLTREELLELFPGTKNLKLRRKIFEMIQNQKPVKPLPPTGVNNGITSRGKLMYQMVVTATTFGAHDQLMEKVKNEVKDQFDLVQSYSNDYDVTIVFCPIVSRMGPDVESALRDVKGNKPVILVLMHHAYETKVIPNVQQGANVLLQVNVFFHETKHGLLHCGENRAVVCEITKYLKEIPIPYAQVVATSWTPRSLHQTPSPPTSYQKPVKQPRPTGVNNGIPSGGSSDDRMDTSDQQPSPKKERSKVVNKWKETESRNTRKAKLVYQMVVTGTTFGAHFHLMEKVKMDVKDQFDLVQSNSDDYDVTIVFCPIVSCIGPDVESALRDVKGDKPVILVLMHHAYEAKFVPNVQHGANVQLQVNVFFHETKPGLVHCRENGAVVCEITKYLQEIPISNTQVVAAGSSGISDSMLPSFWGLFHSKK